MADPTNLLQLEHEILPVLTQRRSPRAYLDTPVSPETLNRIFAAATSAASCIGEQPWRYLAANRAGQPEAFGQILATLRPFNQVWAKTAPVLVIGLTKRTFAKDGNPNDYARHDLGQATATLAIQAAELGLQVHQMGGFDPEAVRTAFQVPADFDIVTTFTLGYPGPAELLEEPLRSRELAPRSRMPVEEILFWGAWPTPDTEDYTAAQK